MNRPQRAEVVKLDRGFPLVRTEEGIELRCEHATDLVKHGKERAVIGDEVEISLPEGHDMGLIERIRDRKTVFVRKDPTERAIPQILAANFDRVIIVQPLDRINLKRLERELVMAFETGARVSIVLTKADLLRAQDARVAEALETVRSLAGPDVEVLPISRDDPRSIEALRRLIPAGTTAILIGRSGVGKSTMVNLLLGRETQRTSSVREADGKGRHTTVAREMLTLPHGGRVVDMPGVRGLGLWDADSGIENAFSDIEELAAACRFRDCKHGSEPGCAVRRAIEEGALAQERLDSYLALKRELEKTNDRRRRSKWKNK